MWDIVLLMHGQVFLGGHFPIASGYPIKQVFVKNVMSWFSGLICFPNPLSYFNTFANRPLISTSVLCLLDITQMVKEHDR